MTPPKALVSRAAKISKTKFEAKWHEHSERMRMALGYTAIGEPKKALELLAPALEAKGEDTYGDTLEFIARDATAFAMRLAPSKKDLSKSLAALGRVA